MSFKDKKDQYACQNRWYARNKKSVRARHRRNKNAKVAWFNEFKATLRCARCPEIHPACLEFHHRDPTQKDLEISRAARYWSKEHLMREIAKCDVLCSNCHRKFHYDAVSFNGRTAPSEGVYAGSNPAAVAI